MSEDYGVLSPYSDGSADGSYDGQPIQLSGIRFFPRPLWASFLYSLSTPPENWSAGFSQLHLLGFTGVRVFCGALQQVGLTPEQARDRLPLFLAMAANVGLFVQVVAITNSAVGGGYDIATHLDDVARICTQHPNALLEVANEPYHETQNATCHDPAALLALARTHTHGLSFALGAAAEDELDSHGIYAYEGGAWNTAHLNRDRDFWNQVRRVKELYDTARTLGAPMMSGEPIGAAEAFIPGKRMDDSLWFFTYGLLCRAFDVGCVFHSEQGLQGTLLSGNQLVCADATVRGFHWPAVPGAFSFYNARWPGSPVLDADFTKVVRCYSFLSPLFSFTACLGWTPGANIQFGNGWAPDATLDLTSTRGNGTLRLVTLTRS